MKLVFILRKNLFPIHLIAVYQYLNKAIDEKGFNQTIRYSNTTSQGKQLPYLIVSVMISTSN